MAGKRRWFRIHLSTAIVLMVVSSILMWANTRPYETKTEWPERGGTKLISVTNWGWPWIYANYSEYFNERGGILEYHPQHLSRGVLNDYDGSVEPSRLAINVLVALAILAATAFGCEWTIRWQGSSKMERQL